jgi:hypothetical protein
VPSPVLLSVSIQYQSLECCEMTSGSVNVCFNGTENSQYLVIFWAYPNCRLLLSENVASNSTTFSILYNYNCSTGHVKWVPFHHGMARPQVADGEGCQIWRVPENILNKQSRRAERGWSSSLGIGLGANNPQRKTSNLLRIMIKSLGPGWILWHEPSTEKWIQDLAPGMLGAFIGQGH